MPTFMVMGDTATQTASGIERDMNAVWSGTVALRYASRKSTDGCGRWKPCPSRIKTAQSRGRDTQGEERWRLDLFWLDLGLLYFLCYGDYQNFNSK